MDQIKIGVGVIIWQEGRLLLGKRLSQHGHAKWSFSGGHVEFGETPEMAAIRETVEETGLVIDTLEKFHFTSDLFENGSQYITLFFVATAWHGEVKNLEPEKCAGWEWFDLQGLPAPLFQPIISLFSERIIVPPAP